MSATPTPYKQQPVPKYRPVLTAAQITHILSLVRGKELPTRADLEILAVLSPFEAKILMGGVKPAYTPAEPAPSLESSIGMEIEASATTGTGSIESESKEDYWAVCYAKLQSQGMAACTVVEIQAAKEYMYLNDLMSPEDKADFEADLGDLY